MSEATVALVEDGAVFGSRQLDMGNSGFNTLREVQVLVERYRRTYNRVRPHSSLGYRPPAPDTVMLPDPVPVLAGLT